jgi:hypothetical protein
MGVPLHVRQTQIRILPPCRIHLPLFHNSLVNLTKLPKGFKYVPGCRDANDEEKR